MKPVMAAGSLRRVWPALMEVWAGCGGKPVTPHFGPAGLLCDSIEAGEPCSLLLSANGAHPQRLLSLGRALSVTKFASNSLCLTVRASAVHPDDNWQTLLGNPALRLGMSTPGCDPCGDYAAALLQLLAEQWVETGPAIAKRALPLVGGRGISRLPAGALAASWLIDNDLCDLFIGYTSYAPRLRNLPALRVYPLPASVNPAVSYELALMDEAAAPLARFMTCVEAQQIFAESGFGPPLEAN
ncbi:hypothetical protein TUM12370_20780 [Salmonella enterica subsp. enterica serovar Choleraesuis]|nr:hypothetical protein TUM12370_20780 [Salmonella enterica subsp. enterica serovar Choleraesuis]